MIETSENCKSRYYLVQAPTMSNLASEVNSYSPDLVGNSLGDDVLALDSFTPYSLTCSKVPYLHTRNLLDVFISSRNDFGEPVLRGGKFFKVAGTLRVPSAQNLRLCAWLRHTECAYDFPVQKKSQPPGRLRHFGA